MPAGLLGLWGLRTGWSAALEGPRRLAPSLLLMHCKPIVRLPLLPLLLLLQDQRLTKKLLLLLLPGAGRCHTWPRQQNSRPTRQR